MAESILTRNQVFDLVCEEREHQCRKYGNPRAQSLPGFLLIIEGELEEAKLAWVKGGEGRNSAMHEVLQIAAVAVAALEKYGAVGCPRSTDDAVVCAPDVSTRNPHAAALDGVPNNLPVEADREPPFTWPHERARQIVPGATVDTCRADGSLVRVDGVIKEASASFVHFVDGGVVPLHLCDPLSLRGPAPVAPDNAAEPSAADEARHG